MENQSMSAKKNTTGRKAKVTQGRSQKAIETKEQEGPPTALIELRLRTDHAGIAEYFTWETDGLIYSKMLSSPECPKAFRETFTNLFTDHLLSKCETAHPFYISAFFPLVMLALQDSIPCDSVAIADALRTLRETLAPELTEKILAALEGDGLEA
jgi:hypothetical protein